MVATVEALLALEQLDANLFRGRCHEGAPLRAFGGQVAGQALTAAAGTASPGLAVHSLHGYFLRPGDTRRPIIYMVERLREGRTYVARRATAVQAGEAIFTLAASFKHAEVGGTRHGEMPRATPPEQLPDPHEAWSARRGRDCADEPWRAAIAMRYVPEDHSPRTGVFEQKVWLKSASALPEDPHVHVCALTYASDLSLAQTAALDLDPPTIHSDRRAPVFMTSLDHAMWFHAPFRADDWLLFVQRSPSAGDGRGFAMGEFWTRDGRLVASAVQETVLRARR